MRRWVWFAAILLLMLAYLGDSARAESEDAAIRAFAASVLGVSPETIDIAPAGELGQIVSINRRVVGYVGSTWEIARTAGYSGRPVDILVLVDTEATIRGTLLVKQEEPVLTLGITPEQIAGYVGSFAGYDLKAPLQPVPDRSGRPVAIAGATISSGVIRSGIIRTARTLAASHGLLGSAGARQIDLSGSTRRSWDELVAEKALARLSITAQQADAAIGVSGNAAPGSTFIELFAGVIDPPPIGASLLGEGEYAALAASMGPQDHALFIAANGLYSFKGTSWRKSGQFERIELVQGSRTIALLAPEHRQVAAVVAPGRPELRETAVFVLPQETGFDATAPFTLALLASREDAAGTMHMARFTLDYAIPSRYVKAVETAAAAGEQPLWEQNWRERTVAIGVVVLMLLALYLILIFQNQIAARSWLYRQIRLGYLLTTVVVLGGFLSAQLSVVHVLTFVQALRTEFSWGTFLLDPVTFIIWAWVAVAMLFWGRVYCGWLCPFGALQELLNKLARRLGVRQFSVPFMLHERLWPIKYIVFLGLVAASLASMTLAFKGAEAEPFKTAVAFRFVREWPFVAYAGALLAAGLFVERFYCRYLCALGAALAIPARLRMFEWLKRRPQCGRECRICSVNCPVQAIHPEGQINPNECVYCLNCQTLYYDEHICPPLKARAARRPDFTRSASNVT